MINRRIGITLTSVIPRWGPLGMPDGIDSPLLTCYSHLTLYNVSTMAKQKVYIETSVVSYYASRPSRDLVIAARQETTRELWPMLVNRFDRYISMLVLMEINKGDPTAVNERKKVISDLPVLDVTPESESLAEAIVSEGLIPERFGEDSLHIALAVVNGMDYLVTWNFRHLNNALIKIHIMRFIEKQGYVAPVICSPDELLGDSS